MRPPDAERRPRGAAVQDPHRTAQVKTNGTRWVDQELAAVEAKLHAARITLANGIIPTPTIRSAAIGLVALDAALRDDLAVVAAMAGELST